jgi:hypothetical protein
MSPERIFYALSNGNRDSLIQFIYKVLHKHNIRHILLGHMISAMPKYNIFTKYIYIVFIKNHIHSIM